MATLARVTSALEVRQSSDTNLGKPFWGTVAFSFKMRVVPATMTESWTERELPGKELQVIRVPV